MDTKPRLDALTVRRLVQSRYFLALGKEHGRSERELDAFVTINLLHDAIEAFLVAAAHHFDLSIKPRTEFSTYLDKVDEVIQPKKLPFRIRLNQINKARVNAKHDLITPDRSEMPGFVLTASEFLSEASRIIFGIEYSEVSLIGLLSDGERKDNLFEAEKALSDAQFEEVLIACRKALYLTFEHDYDIREFGLGENSVNFFKKMSCKAPYYARNPEYIKDKVLTPFDFIVLDHARIDGDMVKDGLDSQTFWNLWRLTPQVYRSKDGEWLVKRELDKLSDISAKENANYVLENTIDILLQYERKKRSLKMVSSGRWELPVKYDGTRVFKKASLNSAVVGEVAKAGQCVSVYDGTPSLEGTEYFWRVFVANEDGPLGWLSGFILQDDLKFA